MKQQKLPLDWLIARVVPVHKSGGRFNIEKYMPIWIIWTCCKIFEHILSKQLFSYLERTNLFFPNQSGFRRKLSTVTQLVPTIHDFSKVLNESEPVDAVCLELSKAFELVPHAEVLGKFNLLGVNKELINWIKSYLTSRLQHVKIRGAKKSTILNVTPWVPQGSVLGTVLFLCYINDIAENIDSSLTVRLFADVCLIYYKLFNQNDQATLNSALEVIHQWCTKSKMKINFNKTVFARITNKTKSTLLFDYELNGKRLEQVTNFKYIGVIIAYNLN